VNLELVEAAKERILGSIYPCVTQMDFNIGAALWCVCVCVCVYVCVCVLTYII
jgi:hypothetical protein